MVQNESHIFGIGMGFKGAFDVAGVGSLEPGISLI
jgi:hypothetical protein